MPMFPLKPQSPRGFVGPHPIPLSSPPPFPLRSILFYGTRPVEDITTIFSSAQGFKARRYRPLQPTLAPTMTENNTALPQLVPVLRSVLLGLVVKLVSVAP